MLLTYLYHSCFAIEGDGYTILFDYFNFPDPINLDATIHRLIHREGKLYILSSHHHPDHFSPSVLSWKEERPDIHFIFSRDILAKKLATPEDAFYLRKGESYNDGIIDVEAFGSTDAGVSFLVSVEKKHIFHAGDLNNWHWNEESTTQEIQKVESDFRKEFQQIRNKTTHLFLAMFPVDSRLGKDYMKGVEEFVTRIKCDIFAPMHAWERYNEANRFKIFAITKGIRFISIYRPGECLNYKQKEINMEIKATFDHFNINVTNLEKSIEFYNKALGLKEAKRKEAADGSFILVYLSDGVSPFLLELTWLRDHPENYELGENESHLCFRVEGDYEKVREYHKEMNCVCYENHNMGLYFINDPDDYWIEVLPARY